MKKIPTLFVRNPDDMKHVLPDVTPGCEWVIEGEGMATRKWDGICTMFDGEKWFVRRIVKPGKPDPDHFVVLEVDPQTGNRVGWEPADQSGFYKFLKEAVAYCKEMGLVFEPVTYELCGPKINKNPEGEDRHVLLRHGNLTLPHIPRNYEALRDMLSSDTWGDAEGVVWHHEDGRMAKIKRRDFT